jgi:GntR family transcriptional regulator
MEKFSGTFTSLYAFLEQQYHIVFTGADEWISAVAADFSESQILRLPIGAPLLCSRRICSNGQGPFEYSVIKLCAEKYEYNIHLSGRG